MPQNVYTTCSPIVVGCFLYTNSGLTTPVFNGNYSNGTDVFTVSGGAGEITSSAPCATSSTTTTTTTAAQTIFCDCGSGCLEYLGTECPPGCTPC
jgi:hypothetical protein